MERQTGPLPQEILLSDEQLDARRVGLMTGAERARLVRWDDEVGVFSTGDRNLFELVSRLVDPSATLVRDGHEPQPTDGIYQESGVFFAYRYSGIAVLVERIKAALSDDPEFNKKTKRYWLGGLSPTQYQALVDTVASSNYEIAPMPSPEDQTYAE